MVLDLAKGQGEAAPLTQTAGATSQAEAQADILLADSPVKTVAAPEPPATPLAQEAPTPVNMGNPSPGNDNPMPSGGPTGAVMNAMTSPVEMDNDLSGAVLDYTRQLSDEEADVQFESILARAAAREKPQQQANTGAPQPEGEVTTAAPEPAQPAEEDGGMLDTAWQVAKPILSDVGKGLAETPRAMYNGVIKAGQEALNTAYDLAEWRVNNDPLLMTLTKGQKVTVPAEERASNTIIGKALMETPESLTGRLVQDATQFLAGFGLSKGPVEAGTTALSKFVAASGRGAVADFSFMPAQESLLQSLAEKYEPIKDLFNTKPFSKAEQRAVNALEGIGLGALTEGVVKGVRAVKAWRAGGRPETMADAATQFMRDQKAAEATLNTMSKTDVMKLLGDPNKPLVGTTQREMNAAIANDLDPSITAMGKPYKKAETYINWSRIDSTDDVKNVMAYTADDAKAQIAKAQGNKTFAEIKMDADHIDAWDVLTQRRKGQPLSDVESVAARNLWAQATNKLVEVAEVATNFPTPENMLAFRKMLAVQGAIQEEVLGARAEASRALSAWRIPAQADGKVFTQDIQNALDAMGGADVTVDLAAKVLGLAKSGQIRALARFSEKGAAARTLDATSEFYKNALLSAPGTHMTNVVSNFAVLAQQVGERKLAELVGDGAGVVPGEAYAMMSGIIGGVKDAFKAAYKVAASNDTGYTNAFGKVEGSRVRNISSAAFGLKKDAPLGKVVDLLGSIINAPGQAMGIEDEFFKTLAVRGNIHADAVRYATNEMRLGKLTQDQFKARVGELISNPTQTMMRDAEDFAKYVTFSQDPSTVARGIMRFQNKTGTIPFLARMVLPFVRTPENIALYTFERTPFAPLMNSYKEAIAAGGARADIAKARLYGGTAVMLVGLDAAMNGFITGAGPKDRVAKEQWQREGYQPYSIRLPGSNTWYSLNRFDSFTSQLVLGATLVEVASNATNEDDERTSYEIMTGLAGSIGSMLMDKTYFTSVQNFFKMLDEPDNRTGAYLSSIAGGFVPAIASRANRSFSDPILRETHDALDAMISRTPGLSDKLPPRRDAWGRPIKAVSPLGGYYDFFSPIPAREYAPEPIDKELDRLQTPVSKPAAKVTFKDKGQSVQMDLDRFPGAYSRYLELAGNAYKDPAFGMGCMDTLNAIVEGNHPLSSIYKIGSDGPDGRKATFLRNQISKFRDGARKQLLEEFPELKAAVNEKADAFMQLRLPVTEED